MNILALLLGGGMGLNLSVLAQHRTKPAIPFAGKYRIIDFPISNLVNSGVRRIAILTQFKPFSLIDHLGDGEPWFDNHQHPLKLQIWQPGPGRTDRDQYIGTADAVYQNRKYILEDGSEHTLILSGDHIYKQDFSQMLRFHIEKGAELTIATTQVNPLETERFGMLRADQDGRITSFIEKPPHSQETRASMGIYIFKTAYLLRLLGIDALDSNSHHDFGRDIIPQIVAQGHTFAYPFTGYWVDIGSVDQYWRSNLDLLDDPDLLDMESSTWTIQTRPAKKPSAVIRNSGSVTNSLISDGCVIEGQVIHSVLSPGVRVEAGAVVRDAIILNDATIRARAVVEQVIIDKEAIIGADAQVGGIVPPAAGNGIQKAIPNLEEPAVLTSGITVIGKRAYLPESVIIGRNCRIDADVVPADFERLVLPSGITIHHRNREKDPSTT